MSAETIREMLHRQPFEPFEVVMSNGDRYPVRHPGFAMLVRQTLVSGLLIVTVSHLQFAARYGG